MHHFKVKNNNIYKFIDLFIFFFEIANNVLNLGTKLWFFLIIEKMNNKFIVFNKYLNKKLLVKYKRFNKKNKILFKKKNKKIYYKIKYLFNNKRKRKKK